MVTSLRTTTTPIRSPRHQAGCAMHRDNESLSRTTISPRPVAGCSVVNKAMEFRITDRLLNASADHFLPVHLKKRRRGIIDADDVFLLFTASTQRSCCSDGILLIALLQNRPDSILRLNCHQVHCPARPPSSRLAGIGRRYLAPMSDCPAMLFIHSRGG